MGKVVGRQHERFKEAARELGADESDGALDRIMGKLDLKKQDRSKQQADQPEDGAIDHGPNSG